MHFLKKIEFNECLFRRRVRANDPSLGTGIWIAARNDGMCVDATGWTDSSGQPPFSSAEISEFLPKTGHCNYYRFFF
jgi:hypothetical protein